VPFQSGLEYRWSMNKLTLELPDETVARLKRTAERLGTPVESLATASLAELVSRSDEQFAEAARRVLEKNRGLCRRLA
jgi:predicted transcriptional regulator